MKFNQGDRIREIATGDHGTIAAISYNSVNRENEYYVKWDKVPTKQYCYPEDHDSYWDLLVQLPSGNLHDIHGFSINRDAADSLSEEINKFRKESEQRICNHEYVDVGFVNSKMVCKHCDKDQ